jgi:hypothetical protein
MPKPGNKKRKPSATRSAAADVHAAQIADAIANLAMARATNYVDAVHNDPYGTSKHWCDLADHLARTQYARLSDPDDRRSASEQEAAFMIGLAIGRRMGGAR